MDAGPVTAEQERRLRFNGCERKVPYSRRTAMRVAEQMRSKGYPVTAYACCFSDEHHWHVGRSIAMCDLMLLARFLRFGVSCGD